MADPVLRDDFARADSTASMGSAPTGQAWAPAIGTWGIVGGRGYCVTNVDQNQTAIESGLVDGTFDVWTTGTFSSPWDNLNVHFRGIDNSNYLLLQHVTGTINLMKRDAGSYVSLVNSGAFATTDGATQQYRIVCAGNSIQVYCNDVLRNTHTLVGGDTKYAAANATKMGFRLIRNGTPANPHRALLVQATPAVVPAPGWAPSPTRRQAAAVLVADGVAAPPGRVRLASYGAGVLTPGTAVVGVEVVTEAQLPTRPGKRPITLTRFAPGTPIPGGYRVITEGPAEG